MAHPAIQAVDIHLLSRAVDDGSPFGVSYSTRRLTLLEDGTVTCDRSRDGLWERLATGIPEDPREESKLVLPGDGVSFLNALPNYFQFQHLGDQPLVYERRGSRRPDNFRIVWRRSEYLSVSHGFQFSIKRSRQLELIRDTDLVPVARTDGWQFFHEFNEVYPAADYSANPRQVIIDLVPDDRPVIGIDGKTFGTDQIKDFVRAFLRRFFERQDAGLDLGMGLGVFSDGDFAWRGGC